MPATLDRVLDFLARRSMTAEVIVVDDGSTDETAAVVASFATSGNVRLIRLSHHGKAVAVRRGVASARGRFVIFTDADLSTPIEHVDAMLRLLRDDADVVIGTREGVGSRRVGEPFYRHAMGRLYNFVVQRVALSGIADTQCGFKGFRAEVARDIFSRIRLYPDDGRVVRGPLVTGFDVEVLFIARRLGYRIRELPVTWRHVEGSKVRPAVDSLVMLRDVLAVRLYDRRGVYGHSTEAGRPAAREVAD